MKHLNIRQEWAKKTTIIYWKKKGVDSGQRMKEKTEKESLKLKKRETKGRGGAPP